MRRRRLFSREPRQLGSLRGQDVGKAFLMAVMAAGCLALTVAGWLVASGYAVDLTWLREMFRPAGG